jgi:formaldehyde-activating enzyme involved in methanogenesis
MTYQAKYIRTSKIKDLMVEGDTKIRISGDAKDKLAEYLDEAIAEAVKHLIEKLPRKTKGSEKGELKRITLQMTDFE